MRLKLEDSASVFDARTTVLQQTEATLLVAAKKGIGSAIMMFLCFRGSCRSRVKYVSL